jgi:VWFA-related protein
MNHPNLLLFGFAYILLSSSLLRSQAPNPVEDQGTLIKITARTVVVDVVVTDKNGKAVPNLQKESFQISEDGKPQTISFFDPHFPISASEALSPTPLPANTFTNVPSVAPNEAINVLLMDALNTQTDDQAYYRLQMAKYLALLPPNIRIGIFMLSERLRLIQGFTEDSNALRAAINKFAANPSPSALLSTPAESGAQNTLTNMIREQATTTGSAQLADSAAALQGFLQQEASFESNQRTLRTLYAMQALAQYLAGVPGRKNLIWFVGSFPLCSPGIGTSTIGCPYEDEYRKTVNMLAGARVSVYPIDAVGVAAPNGNIGGPSAAPTAPPVAMASSAPGSATTVGPPAPGGFGYINREIWAEQTGGKTYHGNDLKSELEAAIDNGSRYYSLAYVPTNTNESGRERKIEVRVPSGKYTLSYRRGYFEQTVKEQKAAESAPATDPLRPLMDRGMPNFSELHYRIKVAPAVNQPSAASPHAGDNADLKPPFTRYTIGFSLNTDGLNLVPDPDGVRRKPIEVALLAYSQSGQLLNWQVRTIGLAIRPEQWAIAQSSGIPFHFDFDAPAGDVYLRTGVYDTSSSKAGTLEIPLSAITLAVK